MERMLLAYRILEQHLATFNQMDERKHTVREVCEARTYCARESACGVSLSIKQGQRLAGKHLPSLDLPRVVFARCESLRITASDA